MVETADLFKPKENSSWQYPYFREYLLALTRGKDFLLPINQYPNKIQLSNQWHETLDRMRRDTLDGKEKWSLIGFKDDRRSLWLPTAPVTGEASFVGWEHMSKQIDRAKEKEGITELLGDIHTHPSWYEKKIWGPFKKRNSNVARFSAADLYTILLPSRYRPIIGVVEGNDNLFAFRTRSTRTIAPWQYPNNQDEFERYWYTRGGFVYKGSVREYGADRAVPISADASGWKVNTLIADHHDLVFYRGQSGKDLNLVYKPNK